MTDADAVLAANLEFYRAFATRDIAAMDAIWARRAPVGLRPSGLAGAGRPRRDHRKLARHSRQPGGAAHRLL